MAKGKLKPILMVILLTLIISFWFSQPKTPLTALEKKYTGMKESILRYSLFIEQIDINPEESLLFYFNGNGNVNCAVAEKRLFGYTIADVNAELVPYREDLRVGLYGSTYNKGNKWVYFGIIHDDSVEKIIWNNTEGIRFSAVDLNMVYAVGDGEFNGQEYILYDSDGNELKHHK